MEQEANPPPSVSHGLYRKPAGHDCPECGGTVTPRGPRQLYCSPACKRAWQHRAAVRGRQILPHIMAARATRDGTRGDEGAREVGAHAAFLARQLLQQWRDEDAAAGRMDAVRLAQLRRRFGHDWR